MRKRIRMNRRGRPFKPGNRAGAAHWFKPGNRAAAGHGPVSLAAALKRQITEPDMVKMVVECLAAAARRGNVDMLLVLEEIMGDGDGDADYQPMTIGEVEALDDDFRAFMDKCRAECDADLKILDEECQADLKALDEELDLPLPDDAPDLNMDEDSAIDRLDMGFDEPPARTGRPSNGTLVTKRNSRARRNYAAPYKKGE